MAPDLRRRLIKAALIFLPLLGWLGAAMTLSEITPRQITWRVLYVWLRATPHHTALFIAPSIGFALALVLGPVINF